MDNLDTKSIRSNISSGSRSVGPNADSPGPSGLDYLSVVDQLLVHQDIQWSQNDIKYSIKNSDGQNIFFAIEDNQLSEHFCGSLRSFEMKIADLVQTEVIHLRRPLRCVPEVGCCGCQQFMEVVVPPGVVAGSVEQEWCLCWPRFAIKNAAGDVVLRIKRPCTFSVSRKVDFCVYSRDGKNKLGRITKQGCELAPEVFTDTDSDYFGITFPIDLDVRIKAVLLGALFLIHFMYFEET